MKYRDLEFIGNVCIAAIIIFGLFFFFTVARRYAAREKCAEFIESYPVYWEQNSVFDYGCYIDLEENKKVKFEVSEDK
jgi:hypothetical protein